MSLLEIPWEIPTIHRTVNPWVNNPSATRPPQEARPRRHEFPMLCGGELLVVVAGGDQKLLWVDFSRDLGGLVDPQWIPGIFENSPYFLKAINNSVIDDMVHRL